MTHRALALGAALLGAVLALTPAAAVAGPLATPALKSQAKSDAFLVHDSFDDDRPYRRHYHKRRGTRVVEAPFTYVETRSGRVIVDAPFASVRVGRRGVWVRAPFVDRYYYRD